jgi:hypothetical protein
MLTIALFAEFAKGGNYDGVNMKNPQSETIRIEQPAYLLGGAAVQALREN